MSYPHFSEVFRSLRRLLRPGAANVFLFLTGLFLCAPLALAWDEPRTALVIGCDYQQNDPENWKLFGTERDATAMADLLRDKLGFAVTFKMNPTRQEMQDLVDSFGKDLKRRSGIGLFYFSGHGVQFEGRNYLIPVKSGLMYQEDLDQRAVYAQGVVKVMRDAQNGLNLLFLDACRNNLLHSRDKDLRPADQTGDWRA